MRFNKLDLNLLVALDALLAERSVSRAADRICLSQSAASSALGRLRQYFHDELLVVKGRQMVLTARAEALVEPVRNVLEQVRTTIAIAPPFNPGTTERTLRIMVSDYATQVFLGEFLPDLVREAPTLHFEIQSPRDELIDGLERWDVDLLFSLDHELSTEHPMQELFVDDYVVIGWAGNPALNQDLTKEAFFAMTHVAVEFDRSRHHAFDENFMRRHAFERRIAATVPSFLSVPPLLVGSDWIALMQRRLATQMVKQWPLRLIESPVKLPLIREAVQWHRANAADPVIKWVVERLSRRSEAVGLASDKTNIIPFGEIAARSQAGGAAMASN